MLFANVRIRSVQKGKQIKIMPLQNQYSSNGLYVPVLNIWGCKAMREEYPVGTEFVADLYLVRPKVHGNYFRVRTGHVLDIPMDENIKWSYVTRQLRMF